MLQCQSFHWWSLAGSSCTKTVYSSLIQPFFYYCEAVRGNLNIGPASKIQKLQNNFVNWDTLATRRDKVLCLLVYDIIKQKCALMSERTVSNGL